MKALARTLPRLRKETFDIAMGACLALDELRRSLDPMVLQAVQEQLCAARLRCAQSLQTFRRRKEVRRGRVRSRLRRSPVLRESVGRHNELLAAREAAMEERRRALFQIGDGIAWIVLNGDPRAIAPLFVPGRTHDLPADIGLEAPLEIAKRLHGSGLFAVVINDLTRCIGTGDLTLVHRRSPVPWPIEIKASWVPGEGRHAEIDLLSPAAADPASDEVFQDLTRVLELQERSAPGLHPKWARQADEVVQRVQLSIDVRRHLMPAAASPEGKHWKSVRNVLRSADIRGQAFDIIETGHWLFCLRLAVTDDSESALRATLRRLCTHQPAEEVGVAVSTAEVAQLEGVSPFLLPVCLWPLPADLRAALLSGRLFLAATTSSNLWERAMGQEGIRLEQDVDHWRLYFEGSTALVDTIELHRIRLGVALGGWSATAVARSARRAMSGQ